MTQNNLLVGISQLLQTDISQEHFERVVSEQTEARLKNALSRALKRETGAYRFLRNCFPVRENLSVTQPSNNDNFYPDDYPMPEDDEFPADHNATHSFRSSVPAPPPVSRENTYSPGREAQSEDRTKYLDHHVYGGKGALCIQADYKEKHDLNTIAVDGAPSAGIRKYSWDKKIRIQLTREELPHFFAVFMGMSPYCKLNNHGPGNNKTLEIEDQGGHLFVRMYGPGQSVSVKILPSDAFYVAQIIMRQMLRNAPWLDSAGILNLVRMVVANRTEKQPVQRRQQS